MSNLLLHAGAQEASLYEVGQVQTPERTQTWTPVPHTRLINAVRDSVRGSGFNVAREEYGLWKDGNRMFGVWSLTNGQNSDDYSLALGLRNSHDQSFSAGLAVGSRVFVCDNLAFSAEITVARKHTRYILHDLNRLVATAVGRIGEHRLNQDSRIEAYKARELDSTEAHDLLVRSVDAKVIANATLPKVLKEYRSPRHEEFAPRNAWSLFNAYTEILKGSNPLELPSRTQRLHGLLDLASDAHLN